MYYFLFTIIICSFLISIGVQKYRILSNMLAILILIIVTFMIGLRYGVGIDYYSYEYAFNFRYNVFDYEPLFSLLMYFVKVTFNKFYVLTFIMIFITNVFIYLGLKKRNIKNEYLLLSVFIYSSNMALIFTNLMRQGVAVAIFFYASIFIKQRNFKKYFIYILIGAGFHLSILILLPLYFIPKFKMPIHKYLFGIFFNYFIIYIGWTKSIFNFIVLKLPKYSIYYNYKDLFNQNIKFLSLGVLLNIVYIFILLIVTKEKNYYEYVLEKNYYMIGILINILALSSFMFDRIGIYFFVFGIAAIPIVVKSIKNSYLKLICFILAISIASAFFVQSLFINAQALKLEYKSVFFLK